MTNEEITQLLNGMGNTSIEVAAFLKQQGIKGRRYNANNMSCPVKQYLVNKGAENFSVNTNYVRIRHQEDKPFTFVDLPDGVSKFVHDFDNGKYPELAI